jgi:L-aspartate oxidase
VNGAGQRFVEELLPRDEVARAVFRENRAGRGPVALDLRHLDPERVRTRFPRIHATCLRYGVDITRDLVPVTPAAHYLMGGVASDLFGRTSLPGLYAAGEVAATGVHGANRLASNSLLEGLVFGARAASAMAEDETAFVPSATPPDSAPRDAGGRETEGGLRGELQRRAWEGLGLERDAAGLSRLLVWLERVRAAAAPMPGDREAAELRNLADVAWAMARSALFREESRGAHFRSDFPTTDDLRFRGHTLLEAAAPRLADVENPLLLGARC